MINDLEIIVFLNQIDFMKRKSIAMNILLTQEIIPYVILRTKIINVVIKLDMIKIDDRVLGLFLTKMLREFGYSEIVIDMIYKIISNNLY